jgi:hypothetical protein
LPHKIRSITRIKATKAESDGNDAQGQHTLVNLDSEEARKMVMRARPEDASTINGVLHTVNDIV